MRILIVDKKEFSCRYIASCLMRLGFLTDSICGTSEAITVLKKNHSDICILNTDILTESNCLFIERCRKKGISIPIITTATESDKILRIRAFEAGADDVIVGGVDFDELAARISAIVRRFHGHPSSLIRLPPYELDTSSRQLFKNGTVVVLTSYEYVVIETLMKNAGKIVTKERLMHQLYSDAYLRNQDVINVLICRLKKKMNAGSCSQIRSVRRLGYIFQPG